MPSQKMTLARCLGIPSLQQTLFAYQIKRKTECLTARLSLPQTSRKQIGNEYCSEVLTGGWAWTSVSNICQKLPSVTWVAPSVFVSIATPVFSTRVFALTWTSSWDSIQCRQWRKWTATLHLSSFMNSFIALIITMVAETKTVNVVP